MRALLVTALLALVLPSNTFAWQTPVNGAPTTTAPKGTIEKRDGQNKTAEPQKTDNKESPNKPPTPTGIQSPNQLEVKQPKSETKCQGSNAKAKDPLYRAYLMATVVGVIGGFIGIGLIVWQARIAKQAADAAKKSADALLMIEKPWILVTINSPDLLEIEKSGLPGIVRIVCRAKNYGDKPVWVTHYTISSSEAPLPTGILYPTERIEAESAFPPGQFVDLAIDLRSSYLPSLVSGESLLYIYGRVTYRDTLGGNQRETRFCYKYHSKSAGSNLLPGFYPGGPPEYNKCT